MRILFLFNHPAPYKVAFFNELQKYMDVCAVFERKENKDRPKAFYNSETIKCEVEFLPGINIGKENHYTNSFIKFLKKELHRFDIVVMNGYSSFTEMKSIDYLKKHHIPYVLYVNGGFAKPNEPFFKHKIKCHYISGASLYLSPDENSNRYLEYYGADKNLIHNYPYSTIHEKDIVEPLTKKEKEELKAKLEIKAKHLFVVVGQFIKRKNLSQVLKIWQKLPDDFVLMLIGNGPQKEEYINFIKQNNIKNIIIHDFIAKPYLFDYIKAADAMLFLSKHDIYGHVVNESLSQGTPVISSSHVNAATKLIKNGENGYLVNLDDEEEIINKIKEISTKDFGKNCVLTSKENTIELMAKEHAKIFKEYLETK